MTEDPPTSRDSTTLEKSPMLINAIQSSADTSSKTQPLVDRADTAFQAFVDSPQLRNLLMGIPPTLEPPLEMASITSCYLNNINTKRRQARQEFTKKKRKKMMVTILSKFINSSTVANHFVSNFLYLTTKTNLMAQLSFLQSIIGSKIEPDEDRPPLPMTVIQLRLKTTEEHVSANYDTTNLRNPSIIRLVWQSHEEEYLQMLNLKIFSKLPSYLDANDAAYDYMDVLAQVEAPGVIPPFESSKPNKNITPVLGHEFFLNDSALGGTTLTWTNYLSPEFQEKFDTKGGFESLEWMQETGC